MKLLRSSALVVLASLSFAGGAFAAPDAAPLVSGDAKRGAALDPVFAHFKLEKMQATFAEEKKVAMLARPLKTSGTIFFVRGKGVARLTAAPKKTQVVISATSITVRDAKRTETVSLDKSKDLAAFAQIFPTLLRGDRAALEKSFDVGLYGSEKDRWALVLTPRADSLKKVVKQVTVTGRAATVVSVQFVETSGDTTDLVLSAVKSNGDVTDSEIAAAFGAP